MPTRHHRTPSLERIALSLPEARAEHRLSQRRLAALSGVSVDTIAKAEHGGRVDPALLIKLAGVFIVLDAFMPPRFDDGIDALLRVARDAHNEADEIAPLGPPPEHPPLPGEPLPTPDVWAA